MDRLAFSQRVVGWSMSAGMTAQLVTDALVMAIWRRGKSDALLGAILPVPMPTFAKINTNRFSGCTNMRPNACNTKAGILGPQCHRESATCADFRTVRLTVLHAEFRLS